MKKAITIFVSIVIISTLVMTATASAYTLLRVGSYGSEVRSVQTKLNALGYAAGPADGIFGSKTRSAVVAFQRNHRLQVDGIVGSVTMGALNWSYERKLRTNGILATSKRLIGVPYLWGGTSTSGFDCSGYTQYVFAKNGVTLPRVSRDQFKVGTPISFSSLRPGDLVFFSLRNDGQVSHVGIYIGSGQFISATTSKGVIISSFTSYWSNIYVGAKRVY